MSADKEEWSLRRQLIKSFIAVGVMRLISLPVGLLTSIILARILGPKAFGQYAFVMALLPLLALPVAGGVPQLLTREVAKYSHTGQWPLYRGVIRSANLWVIFISLMVLAIYLIGRTFAGWPPNEGKWSLIGIIILMVPINGLNAVRNGAIKGLGFPAYSELPTLLIQPLILLAAYTTLAVLECLTLRVALWTQVFAGAAIFIIATILFLRIRPDAFLAHQPIYEAKKWVFSLYPFTLIVLAATLNTQVGIVLLGLLGTDEAVAAMQVGERGAYLVALALFIVNMVISPHIVKTYRDGDKYKLQKLSRQSARGAFFIALPIGLILIFFGKSLIFFSFGEEYVSISYFPLVILVVAQLFNVFFGSVGQFLSMTGHEKDTLKGQFFALFANFATCAIFIPFYGVMGAAIGVSTGIIVWNVLLSILVFKRLKIRPSLI